MCVRILLTTGAPKVRFGTKCPSMMSMWSQSAPLAIVVEQAAPSAAKSEERIDGAIIVLGAMMFVNAASDGLLGGDIRNWGCWAHCIGQGVVSLSSWCGCYASLRTPAVRPVRPVRTTDSTRVLLYYHTCGLTAPRFSGPWGNDRGPCCPVAEQRMSKSSVDETHH